MAISDQNVKSLENVEACEQIYKRRKLESGEAKVGQWQNVNESSLEDKQKEFNYFEGEGDPEYAQQMKEVLEISFTSSEESSEESCEESQESEVTTEQIMEQST